MRYAKYYKLYKEMLCNYQNADMPILLFEHADMELKLKFLSANYFKVQIYYSDFYEEFFAAVEGLTHEGRGDSIYEAFISLFDIIVKEFFEYEKTITERGEQNDKGLHEQEN